MSYNFLCDENCPCGGCPSEGDCAAKKQACADFAYYVKHGVNRNRSRRPDAAVYRKLFPTESGVE
jgi:hypothetical protein